MSSFEILRNDLICRISDKKLNVHNNPKNWAQKVLNVDLQLKRIQFEIKINQN